MLFKTRCYFLFVFFLFLVISLKAQNYKYGLNPPNIKWKQIQIPYTQIVFPENEEKQAQKTANIIKYLNDYNYYSLGERQHKISIYLYNQTLEPNAYVENAPFNSVFYLNGPMWNIAGNTDWLTTIAIHEHRHIQQFRNAKKGFTKFNYYIAGQVAWLALSKLALPRWFWEGDAVFYETALTKGGRGRVPEFENQMKAFVLNEKNINYELASAGSYKKFVPNHYVMGYYMVSTIGKEKGYHTWENLVDDAVRYKKVFFPLKHSFKKHTGLSIAEYYLKMVDELAEEWKNKDTIADAGQIVDLQKKTFTNYNNAKFIDHENIVAEKNGLRDIPTFYKVNIHNEAEKKLTNVGFYSSRNANLSIEQNKMVWSELEFDIRWQNRQYSNIIIYDLDTDKKRALTRKGKYFNPVLSPDATQIASIYKNIDVDNKNELHILDAKNGKLLKNITIPAVSQISFPAWISQENIAVVAQNKNEYYLIDVNVVTGEQKKISPSFNNQIGYLENYNDYILFTGNHQNQENIFAIDKKNQSLHQITHSKFGARQPSVSKDNKWLVYSDFTANGYELKKMALNPNEWQAIENFNAPLNYYFENSLVETIPLDSIPKDTFEVKPYKIASGGVLHTWFRFYSFQDLGLATVIENKMKTSVLYINYLYNYNESTNAYFVGYENARYFPVFFVGSRVTFRYRYTPILEPEVNSESEVNVAILNKRWDQIINHIGVGLPINLTHSNINSNLLVKVSYENYFKYSDVYISRINSNYFAYVNLFDNNTNFSAYVIELEYEWLQRKAVQYQNSRWGIKSDLNYSQTINASEHNSFSFQINSTFYMPGLHKTHSFFIETNYKKEPFVSNYKFSDKMVYARGFLSQVYDEAMRYGFNYKLPLGYPDKAITPLLFVKRVNANFFYDFMYLTINPHNYSEYKNYDSNIFNPLGKSKKNVQFDDSIGVELTMDTRLVRSISINTGIQYSVQLSRDYNTYTRFLLNLIVD